MTSYRWSRAAGAVLRRAAQLVTPEDLPRLDRVDPVELAAAARYHRLCGPVHLLLRDAPPPWAGLLVEEQLSALTQHVRTLAVLRSLAPGLDALGIRWAVVKGPVVAATAYPRPDLRWYGDLDLVVSPTDVRRVLHTLEAAGCVLLDRNWTLLAEQRLGEMHLMSPQGVMIDLHHQLINSGALRDRFRVDVADALRRRRQVDLGAGQFPALGEEDALLHLALHAGLSGGDRLGWLLDVDLTWHRSPPDPIAFVRRAHLWGVGVPVHMVLARCRETLGTPVPPTVMRALVPSSAWRHVVRTVHTLEPVERSTGRRSLPRALVRSAGADPVTTLRAAATRRWRRRRVHAGPFVDDPGDPRSVLHGRDDPAARDAYLDRLAHGR